MAGEKKGGGNRGSVFAVLRGDDEGGGQGWFVVVLSELTQSRDVGRTIFDCRLIASRQHAPAEIGDVAISWFRLDRFDMDVVPTGGRKRDVAVSSRFCLV